MVERPVKITFGEMREMGVRGILIYCTDYRCSHSIAISGDRWADGVRLSDIEAGFICAACGRRGATTSCTCAVLSAARCQRRYSRAPFTSSVRCRVPLTQTAGITQRVIGSD
jgi:hypothetical protein